MTLMETTRKIRTPARSILLAIALLWTTGCTAINHLRDAQDAFSQAAALENSSQLDRIEPLSTGNIAQLTAARAGYASTIHSLDQLDDAQKNELRQEKLWGAALTLRALAEWRAGQFDEALNSADDARELDDQLFPRDAALLHALPALIATDLAHTQIRGAIGGSDQLKKLTFSGGTDADGNQVNGVKKRLVGATGVCGAVATLAAARRKISSDHPLQSYLVQAQLAAYRNFKVAVEELTAATYVGELDATNKAAEQQAQMHLHALQTMVGTSPSAVTLVSHWKTLCGL